MGELVELSGILVEKEGEAGVEGGAGEENLVLGFLSEFLCGEEGGSGLVGSFEGE